MINNQCVALNYTIDGEIAAVASVGDLSVLEHLDCNFDCLNSCSTILQHSHCSCTRVTTCFEVNILIRDRMVASSGVDDDRAEVSGLGLVFLPHHDRVLMRDA